MSSLRHNIQACKKCPLHKDMPYGNCPVPGVGPSEARIMLVGEALGKDESEGEAPFIGLCGQFLDKMLTDAGLNRDDIYVTNVVKCRPTRNDGKANREPSKEEISACKLWLWQEMMLVRPQTIVTLGKVPTYTLLNSRLPKVFTLKKILGKVHHMVYKEPLNLFVLSTEVIPLYHPSYLMQHGKAMVDNCIEVLRKLS